MVFVLVLFFLNTIYSMVLVETAIYSKYGKTKKSLGLIIAYNILWAAGVAAAGSYLKSRAELNTEDNQP